MRSSFAVAPDGLMEIIVTHKSIAVKWDKLPRREKISYKVTAVGSQGAVHNCSVEEAQMAALCENLSPCMEYTVSVRACVELIGCGAPANILASTNLGRKFTCIVGAAVIVGMGMCLCMCLKGTVQAL